MKYAAEVTYSAEWTETVTYDCDPDADHDAVLQAVEDAARRCADDAHPRCVDVDDWRLTGPRPHSHALPALPVEEDWITWGGHRWAVDTAGGCIIREGSPMPATLIYPWSRDITSEDLEATFGVRASPWLSGPHPGRFDPRFAPVREGAEEMVVGGVWESTPPNQRLMIVLRGGEPVAYLMPLQEG